jgi:hypothetical protein
MLKTQHRCCTAIPTLGDCDLKLESSLYVGQVDLKAMSSFSFLKDPAQVLRTSPGLR